MIVVAHSTLYFERARTNQTASAVQFPLTMRSGPEGAVSTRVSISSSASSAASVATFRASRNAVSDASACGSHSVDAPG